MQHLPKPWLFEEISYSQKRPERALLHDKQWPVEWLHVLSKQFSLQDILQFGPNCEEAHSETSK